MGKITVQELLDQYKAECEDIAEQCEEEGYPSNGSNYELRCSYLWENYYLPDLKVLDPETYDPEY